MQRQSLRQRQPGVFGQNHRRCERRGLQFELEREASVHEPHAGVARVDPHHAHPPRAAVVGPRQAPVAQAVGLTFEVDLGIDEREPRQHHVAAAQACPRKREPQFGRAHERAWIGPGRVLHDEIAQRHGRLQRAVETDLQGIEIDATARAFVNVMLDQRPEPDPIERRDQRDECEGCEGCDQPDPAAPRSESRPARHGGRVWFILRRHDRQMIARTTAATGRSTARADVGKRAPGERRHSRHADAGGRRGARHEAELDLRHLVDAQRLVGADVLQSLVPISEHMGHERHRRAMPSRGRAGFGPAVAMPCPCRYPRCSDALGTCP